MNYFKQILRFASPYKGYALLNIIANILYALFSGLSFMVLMPLLKVLFDKEAIRITEKPVYNGFTEAATYFNDYLNYHISQLADNDTAKALTFVIILILTVFFLKNVFNYMADRKSVV